MANYFVTLYNRTSIQFWASDMTHDSHFEQLTTAQEDFYTLNPTASVNEVRNCLLNEKPAVQQLTLDEIKTNALKNINDLSLTILGQFVNDYQFANSLSSIIALDKGWQTTNECVYTLDNAKATIERYNRIGKACKDQYNTSSTQIQNATTEEEVQTVVNNTIELYNAIVTMENLLSEN